MDPQTQEFVVNTIAAALAEADKSQSVFTLRDTLMLVGLSLLGFIAVSLIVVYFVYRYMLKRSEKNGGASPFTSGIMLDNSLANAAHAVIMKDGVKAFETLNREDQFGMPLIFSMIQVAKDISKSLMSMDEKQTYLFNHFSSKMKDHDDFIRKERKKQAIDRNRREKQPTV